MLSTLCHIVHASKRGLKSRRKRNKTSVFPAKNVKKFHKIIREKKCYEIVVLSKCTITFLAERDGHYG